MDLVVISSVVMINLMKKTHTYFVNDKSDGRNNTYIFCILLHKKKHFDLYECVLII